MEDDYDYWDNLFMGIGSLHVLTEDKPRKKDRPTGPRVRLGFHPPERAWIGAPKSKDKTNGTRRHSGSNPRKDGGKAPRKT